MSASAAGINRQEMVNLPKRAPAFQAFLASQRLDRDNGALAGIFKHTKQRRYLDEDNGRHQEKYYRYIHACRSVVPFRAYSVVVRLSTDRHKIL